MSSKIKLHSVKLILKSGSRRKIFSWNKKFRMDSIQKLLGVFVNYETIMTELPFK